MSLKLPWVWLRRLILLGLLFIGLIIAINLWILAQSADYRYQNTQATTSADVALVLGARVFKDGRLSGMLEARLLEALELYQQGKVKKLLLSGDHGQVDYDEVNAMRLYLLAEGVAEEDIFLDHAGFSTYESMYRARGIFQVNTVIVVTQAFHLARAVYSARVMGLDAQGLAAEQFEHRADEMTRLNAREWLARIKAFIELHLWQPQPTYLGERFNIHGDGRVTWDSL